MRDFGDISICFILFNFYFFIYLICKLVMPLRWQPPRRWLTLTGTMGTMYLYSTGQALTVQKYSSSILPRGDHCRITLYNVCTEWFLLSFISETV